MKKETGEAKDLRREAAKLGFVLRDEGTRQYFFLSDTD
ncbi:CysS/YqeB C-terminal domain-containing protein [Paenibacillus larvae]